MAISITVNQVRKVAATNHIYVRFSNGHEREFKDLNEARAWAQEIDVDQAMELMERLFARWYFLRDPNGTTPSLVEGHTITLDLSAAVNLVTVA